MAGLVGARGISPVHDYLARLKAAFGATLVRCATWPFPPCSGGTPATLPYASSPGPAWHCALLFFAAPRRWVRWVLLLLYILYLSLDMAGQEFLSFQWDSLLLEAGFLAIFFGRPSPPRAPSPGCTAGWCSASTFSRARSKLGSHDPAWADFTALDITITRSLCRPYSPGTPTSCRTGFSTAPRQACLAIELVAPFLIFAPRRWRMPAHASCWRLQALIFLTGNYTFFNLLTVALTLFLFDDQALAPMIAGRGHSCATAPFDQARAHGPGPARGRDPGSGHYAHGGNHRREVPEPLETLARDLVAVPGRQFLRPVRGDDHHRAPKSSSKARTTARHWRPYEFRYKPGDLTARRAGSSRFSRAWTGRCGSRRWGITSPIPGFWVRGAPAQGSPEVLGTAGKQPFPGPSAALSCAPSCYDYSFTGRETRARTGAWWKREALGIYLPPVGIKAASESPN